MRTYTLVLVVLGLMVGVVSNQVYAQSACGGVVQPNSDCNNSDRDWVFRCCNGVVQGIGYHDIVDQKGRNKQDHVDAITAVCRGGAMNTPVPSADLEKVPKTLDCKDTYSLVGIRYKDFRTEAGKDEDTLDGVAPICKKGNDIVRIPNADIDNNPRSAGEQMALSSQKVVGFAYKEYDENMNEGVGQSDRADCVALIVK